MREGYNPSDTEIRIPEIVMGDEGPTHVSSNLPVRRKVSMRQR